MEIVIASVINAPPPLSVVIYSGSCLIDLEDVTVQLKVQINLPIFAPPHSSLLACYDRKIMWKNGICLVIRCGWLDAIIAWLAVAGCDMRFTPE